MTKHVSVKAAALVHTFRNPPKVWNGKALAFKRIPAETRKEQSDQGPFFNFQPWYILQGWNLIRDHFRD